MAPSTKPANKSINPNKEDEDQHTVLQAVIWADAGSTRFHPLTYDRPMCLIPLANIPLIEYSLEFLEVGGVEEVFIVCNAHADLIKDYLSSKWMLKKPGKAQFKVHVIVAPEAYGLGDAMRELDGKGLILHDFVLLSGNVVSNMRLDKIVEEHRLKRSKAKSDKVPEAIMTMVMKRGSAFHRTRSHADAPFLVVDPTNSECVYYESLEAYPRKKKTQLETKIFQKSPTLQVRNNLIDCHVDICSPKVLALFTENFDYQDIRRDFVRGILNSDLYDETIHLHVIDNEYGAIVKNTQLYDAVSRDIISRWTFPLVPDSNILSGDTYTYSRRNIYKGIGVVLARSANIEEKVVIGSRSEVGENSFIKCSVIGRGCKIGENVRIENSYIWDNVVIEGNCTIQSSILASGVTIKQSVNVSRGCVIGDNVVVGPMVTLKPSTRLSSSSPHGFDLNDVRKGQRCEPSFIGSEGSAYSHSSAVDEEDDEDENENNIKTTRIGFIHDDFSQMNSEAQSEDIYSDNASDDNESEDEIDEMERHLIEVEETVRRAISEDHTVENALLEINALKMACNIHYKDLPPAVIPTMLGLVDMKALATSSKKIFEKWSPMLARFLSTDAERMDTLTIALNYCKSRGQDGVRLFVAFLKGVYVYDVVEEDLVINWFQNTKWDDEKLAPFKKQVEAFIDYLQESDDDEDDSEEEESDQD